MVASFRKTVQDAVDRAKNAGEKPDYYSILKNSILKYYACDIMYGTCICFVAECMSLVFNYIIRDLIKYIKYD